MEILWKLKIPSKVKIFIWRALHGILPLKCILVNRHIGTSGECPICRSGPEDIRHLLFQCPVALDLWGALGLDGIIGEAIHEDRAGSVILEILLRRQDNLFQCMDNIGLKETLTIACWYLWWLRRRRTHDETVPPVNKCRTSILAMAANFAKLAKPAVSNF